MNAQGRRNNAEEQAKVALANRLRDLERSLRWGGWSQSEARKETGRLRQEFANGRFA